MVFLLQLYKLSTDLKIILKTEMRVTINENGTSRVETAGNHLKRYTKSLKIELSQTMRE